MNYSEMLDNVTLTITNTSHAVYVCTETTMNTYINMTFYIEKFETWDKYWLSFLMNLSGNVVNFYLFFDQVAIASENCDLNGVYNLIGKLLITMLSVQPTEGLSAGNPNYRTPS